MPWLAILIPAGLIVGCLLGNEIHKSGGIDRALAFLMIPFTFIVILLLCGLKNGPTTEVQMGLWSFFAMVFGIGITNLRERPQPVPVPVPCEKVKGS